MGKKILTISIFLALLTLSVFAAYWYYNKYMKKSESPTGNDTPVDYVPPADPSTLIGKTAISKFDGLELLDINGSDSVKTINEGQEAGTITSIKEIPGQGNYYVIDELYLVGIGSITT